MSENVAMAVVAAVIVGFLLFVMDWAARRRLGRPQRDLDAARIKCKHGVNVYALREERCAVCYAEARDFFGDEKPNLTEITKAYVSAKATSEKTLMTMCGKCGYSQPTLQQWFHDCAAGASNVVKTILCGHCGRDSFNRNLLTNIGSCDSPIWRCHDGCKRQPKFKVGQWVRLNREPGELEHIGHLVRIIKVESGDLYMAQGEMQVVGISEEWVDVATPRRGEWWAPKYCKKHMGADEDYLDVPQRAEGWVTDSVTPARILCGCLIPVNFGKGNG